MNINIEYESSAAYQEAVEMWTRKLENFMLADPNAPTSILSYFLCDSQRGMFCPLGYEEYEQIGHAMRFNGALIAAAEKSGFFASAVSHYVSAALSNYDCWLSLYDGVNEILNSDLLCKYLPFRKRVVVAYLSLKSSLPELDEDDWSYFYDKAQNTLFGDVLKGY